MTVRTSRSALLIATLVLGLGCTIAEAQQYPSRPIRLLVPNPPGGATDNLARVIAPKLGELLGQTVVVDNRPGSNGNLSTEATVRATPDGHTLLLGQDSQIVISPHLYRGLPFDTLKDLTPVASLVSTQMLLAVIPSMPV
ncbi:MAG TPA: tripartite tricarboxylate transporter substrate-binding protein, partial [Burkholderiales bacterium]|nr:tripartite tricarboxylate transporter substrate-binding protein [Burkholderiales bacterium]